MTKTLADIKREAREEWLAADEYQWNERGQHPDSAEVLSFLEETLDRLVDEIEKAVVPPEREPFFFETSDYANGYFMGKKKVEAAFTRFKGENHA